MALKVLFKSNKYSLLGHTFESNARKLLARDLSPLVYAPCQHNACRSLLKFILLFVNNFSCRIHALIFYTYLTCSSGNTSIAFSNISRVDVTPFIDATCLM
jgi:hypothetical protein